MVIQIGKFYVELLHSVQKIAQIFLFIQEFRLIERGYRALWGMARKTKYYLFKTFQLQLNRN